MLDPRDFLPQPPWEVSRALLRRYFRMYHASPASRIPSIMREGLKPNTGERPGRPSVHIAVTLDDVEGYAEVNYEEGLIKEREWGIFKIEYYGELPWAIYPDLDWGPTGFYTFKAIPPEYISLIGIYDVVEEEFREVNHARP